MNIFSMKTIRVAAALAVICSSLTAAAAQTATSRIVNAAKNTFLSTLDEKQRQSVLFAFDDEKQRARWSNFPTSVVPRAGVSLKELNTAQRSAALALVSAVIAFLQILARLMSDLVGLVALSVRGRQSTDAEILFVRRPACVV